MRDTPTVVFVVLNAPYVAVIAAVFNGRPAAYGALSSIQQLVLAGWIPVIALAAYAAFTIDSMNAPSQPEIMEESQ